MEFWYNASFLETSKVFITVANELKMMCIDGFFLLMGCRSQTINVPWCTGLNVSNLKSYLFHPKNVINIEAVSLPAYPINQRLWGSDILKRLPFMNVNLGEVTPNYYLVQYPQYNKLITHSTKAASPSTACAKIFLWM